MSTTNLILADGTFKCVVDGNTQLYIFHAVIANNVSVPTLFCLVNGKNKETYLKLLGLVEGIAESYGTTFFNRPVMVMSDFEEGFINAVHELYPLVQQKGCFFHFAQNIRKNGSSAITTVKTAVGESSHVFQLALTTKTRLRMLPLLPENLITTEGVDLIIAEWKEEAPQQLRDVFDGLRRRSGRRTSGPFPGKAGK